MDAPRFGAGDVAGTNIPFTVDGTRYELARPTVAHLAAIEDLISETAYLEAERMSATATTTAQQSRAASAMQHVHRAILEENAHKVGGRLWVEKLSRPADLTAHIVWACLAPRMDLAAVRRLIGKADSSGGLARAIDGVLDFFIVAVSDRRGIDPAKGLAKLAEARETVKKLQLAEAAIPTEDRGTPS